MRHGLTAALAAGSTYWAVKPPPTPPAAVTAAPKPVPAVQAEPTDNRVCTRCGAKAGPRLSGDPLLCSICQRAPYPQPESPTNRGVVVEVEKEHARIANQILDAISRAQPQGAIIDSSRN